MCVSPLVRFRIKKPVPKAKSHLFAFETWDPSTKGFRIMSQKKLETEFKNYSEYLAFMDTYCDYIVIPCGRCVECRKTYARDWSIRCYCESLMHDTSCFITLTLDSLANKKFMQEIEKSYEKNKKKNGQNCYCKYCKNGNKYFRYPIDYSLSRPFIYKWLKKMRDTLYRRYGINVRYFGCGEYGAENDRPHYHILLFGYNFPNIKYKNKEYRKTKVQFSKKGVQMYVCDELMDLYPYGNSFVEDLNLKSCGYVAKYCMKKIKFFDSEQLFDYYYGREPEFLFMSKGNCQSNRCPYINEIIMNCKGMISLRDLNNKYCNKCNKSRGGLGYSWFCKYWRDVLKVGHIQFDGKSYPIPKYFLDILKITDYDKWHDYQTCMLNIYYVKMN